MPHNTCIITLGAFVGSKLDVEELCKDLACKNKLGHLDRKIEEQSVMAEFDSLSQGTSSHYVVSDYPGYQSHVN